MISRFPDYAFAKYLKNNTALEHLYANWNDPKYGGSVLNPVINYINKTDS